MKPTKNKRKMAGIKHIRAGSPACAIMLYFHIFSNKCNKITK